MTDVMDFEKRDTPGPVAIAGMIGIAKAIFEGFFGVLGLAVANSVDDSFGGGILAFGIVYAIASILLLRGNRLGYYLTFALSALALAVAVIYMFSAEGTVFGGTLLIALMNALVLYLLSRKSARDFFGFGARA
jgi:hypothetical protein